MSGCYQSFLHRSSDPGGLSYWVALLRVGVRHEEVIGSIIASDEYDTLP